MATATSVMRVQQLLIGDFDATVGRHGLTFARYEALVLLTFSREGRLPMSKIGQRLMVHPTSATNTIDRLEGQGLVVRKPNPDDGRGKLAEITPQGRELVGRATDDLMRVEFGVSGFDAGQRQQLFDLLRMLRVDAGDFSPASAPAG
jgi:DNA-binding MarR family transcriptional regulator